MSSQPPGADHVTPLLGDIEAEVAGLQDAWTKAGCEEVNLPDFRVCLLTMSALSHIQNRLSPGRYWVLEAERRAPIGVDASLRCGAGICGHHTEAMLAVMRRLGCQARPIGFYFTGPFGTATNHAAVEVLWGGSWHFVDVTNGAVFRRPGRPIKDMLSIAELLATPDPRALAVVNASRPDFQLTSHYIGDPLDYLTSRPDVVIDGDGSIHLGAVHEDGVMRFPLVGVPNYVGRVARSTPGLAEMRLILPIDGAVDVVEVGIHATAGTDITIRVSSGDKTWDVILTGGENTIAIPVRDVVSHLELSAGAPRDEAGYVVLSSVEARLSPATTAISDRSKTIRRDRARVRRERSSQSVS